MISGAEIILIKNLLGAGSSGGGSSTEGITFKGHVATPSDLPSTHNNGDMYIVDDIDPSTPGNQGAKAVWDASSASWVYYDQVATTTSALINDAYFLGSKVSGTKYVDNIHVDGTVKTHTASSTNPHEYIISDLQFNRGTASSLTTYVAKYGEPVFEYDSTAKTYKLKIGDGSSRYIDLPYIGAEFELSADGQSVIKTGSTLQIYGFSTATDGMLPKRYGGALQWVKMEDAINIVNGGALDITETMDAAHNLTETLKVKVDQNTVQIVNDKLHVPFDETTIIKKTNGTWGTVQPVAGNGVQINNDSYGNPVIGTNLVAGDNVTLTNLGSNQIQISAAGGGGGTGGDTVAAGVGINVTTDSIGRKIISGNYVAGAGITMSTSGNKVTINADTSILTNTNRPVRLNGTEVLSSSPTTGFLGFSDTTTDDGILFTGTSSGGETLKANIKNTNILQAGLTTGGKRTVKDLSGNVIIFNCGDARF